jgi:electron transfer flavoprotein-quinone oxidoreductase
MAAQTVKKAKEKKDFSAETLAMYKTMIRESFVLQDIETFRHSLETLESPRMVGFYPQWLCKICEEIFWIDEGAKTRTSSIVWKGLKNGMINIATLKDLWRLRRI